MKQFKSILAVLAFGYAVAFIVFNASYQANVWLLPFVRVRSFPTLVVIVLTAAITLAITWGGLPAIRVIWRPRKK